MKTSIFIFFLLLAINPSFSRSTELNEQTLNLANYIEASIENGNPSFVNSLFAYQYFSHQLLINEIDFKDFNKNFEKELIEFLDPGNIIIEQVNNGTYKYISSHYKGDLLVLTYRAYNETGLDYHEYYLKNIKGEYKIIDIYMYYDDILLSNKVAELYRIVSQNYLPELFEKEDISDSKELLVAEQKLLKYILEGNFKKLLNKWTNLDENIKYDRKIMSYAIRAASYVDIDEMERIYNNICLVNGNVNGMNLIVLEGLFEQKQYNLTLQYIDNLDVAVHSDPYLNYLRASVYKTIEKPQKAEWFLNKFIEDLPDDQSGYFSLLELYLETSNFGDATLLLDKLTDNFGFYKEELKPILANYPNYTDSEEYAQWAIE